MIFVDTNIFMYAVGADHRLREQSREFFENSLSFEALLATSAEVVQELVHAYLPVERSQSLTAALSTISAYNVEVWPLEMDDVMLAWQLREQYPSLSARDLCHLASCRRRGVSEVMTFDRSLRGAFSSIP